MAASIEFLTKKLEEVNISNDCSFGDDLSHEKEFMDKAQKKLNKRFKILKFLIS